MNLQHAVAGECQSREKCIHTGATAPHSSIVHFYLLEVIVCDHSTQMQDNVDRWYEDINYVFPGIEKEYPNCSRYFYTYLARIDEFSNDVE